MLRALSFLLLASWSVLPARAAMLTPCERHLRDNETLRTKAASLAQFLAKLNAAGHRDLLKTQMRDDYVKLIRQLHLAIEDNVGRRLNIVETEQAIAAMAHHVRSIPVRQDFAPAQTLFDPFSALMVRAGAAAFNASTALANGDWFGVGTGGSAALIHANGHLEPFELSQQAEMALRSVSLTPEGQLLIWGQRGPRQLVREKNAWVEKALTLKGWPADAANLPGVQLTVFRGHEALLLGHTQVHFRTPLLWSSNPFAVDPIIHYQNFLARWQNSVLEIVPLTGADFFPYAGAMNERGEILLVGHNGELRRSVSASARTHLEKIRSAKFLQTHWSQVAAVDETRYLIAGKSSTMAQLKFENDRAQFTTIDTDALASTDLEALVRLPDGRYLVGGAGGTLGLWDPRGPANRVQRVAIEKMQMSNWHIRSLAANDAGQVLIANAAGRVFIVELKDLLQNLLP